MCFTNSMWGLLLLKVPLTPSSHTWMN
jgi:hypothetical protein